MEELSILSLISTEIRNASTQAELQEAANKINIELLKKDLIRTGVFAELQDKIADELGARLEHNASQFSNKDLLGYLTAVQTILNKQVEASKEPPQIAIQSNTINFSDGLQKVLSRESRDRIKAAIDQILQTDTTNGDEIING